MRCLCLSLVLFGSLTCTQGITQADDFEQTVRPFLTAHCADCHGSKKQEADLRLDTLSTDLTQPETPLYWRDVIDRLRSGDMPPSDRMRPPAQDLANVISAIDRELTAAAKLAAAHSGPITRRLSRSALNHSVSDLLGLDVKPAEELPPDPYVHGFDNLSETTIATAEWLAAWQLAVRGSIELVLSDAPDPRVHLVFPYKSVIARSGQSDPRLKSISGHNYRAVAWPKDFIATRPGVYDVEVTGWWKDNRELLLQATNPEPRRDDESALHYQERLKQMTRGLPPPENADTSRVVAFYSGRMELSPKGERVISRDLQFLGSMPVSPQAAPIRFACELNAGEGVGIMFLYGDGRQPAMVERENGDRRLNIGEGLYVEEMQVEGPRLPSWPTPLQQELLADPQDVKQSLQTFLSRVFRRPPPESIVNRYVALYSERLLAGDKPVEAMRTIVELSLCSPLFLYTHFDPDRPDAYALAERLSYFLWNTTPDAKLLSAAASGKLLEADELKRQTHRLLEDPRSRRFSQDFAEHWLRLGKLADVTPDRKFNYDPMLQRAVVDETVLFFEEVLRNNLPASTFLDSDFLIVNERLARHYGLKNVKGSEFRRVAIDPKLPRGGLLGQSSILTLTSDGTRTSPVVRGVWILENILGSPPSPPPPTVEPIEPDVRGAVTIREILERHRDVQTCNECHQRIDPMGFALEGFDPVGARRTNYGGGNVSDPETGKVFRQPIIPIDDVGHLSNGQTFQGLPGLKPVLLQQQDRFIHTLVEKLYIQSTGVEPSFAQLAEIDRLVQESAKNDYRFRDLVVAITVSQLFSGIDTAPSPDTSGITP
jgi:hypothetical protein